MNPDDLFRALSAEPQTAIARPDAVEVIVRSVAAAKRRRARVAILASVGAVIILVAGITGSVLTLSSHRSTVPEPAQVSVTSTATPPSRTTGPTSHSTRPSSSRPLVPGPVPLSGLVSSDGQASAVPPAPAAPTPTTSSDAATSSAPSSVSAPVVPVVTTPTTAAVTVTVTVTTVHYQTFRLPSGNIACRDGGTDLAVYCWINTIDFVPVGGPATCPATTPGRQVTASIQGSKTRIFMTCAAPPDSSSYPILQYGQTNAGAGARCTSSADTGVTCILGEGPGVDDRFQLSRSTFTMTGPPTAPTVVTRYAPWAGSAPASGITVTGTTTGFCSGPANYARCFGDNSMIYEPCFVSPTNSAQALCPSTTDPTRVVKMTLTQAFSGVTDPAPQAWDVLLPNGKTCFASTAAPAVIQGQQIYFCTGGGLFFADSIQTTATWTGRYSSTYALDTAFADAASTPITKVWT